MFISLFTVINFAYECCLAVCTRQKRAGGVENLDLNIQQQISVPCRSELGQSSRRDSRSIGKR